VRGSVSYKVLFSQIVSPHCLGAFVGLSSGLSCPDGVFRGIQRFPPGAARMRRLTCSGDPRLPCAGVKRAQNFIPPLGETGMDCARQSGDAGMETINTPGVETHTARERDFLRLLAETAPTPRSPNGWCCHRARSSGTSSKSALSRAHTAVREQRRGVGGEPSGCRRTSHVTSSSVSLCWRELPHSLAALTSLLVRVAANFKQRRRRAIR
jgi:hypothetical protein